MKTNTSLNGHSILEIIVSLVLILLVFLFFSYGFNNIHKNFVGVDEIEAIYKLNTLEVSDIAIQETELKYITTDVTSYYENGLKYGQIRLRSKNDFKHFDFIYNKYLPGEP